MDHHLMQHYHTEKCFISANIFYGFYKVVKIYIQVLFMSARYQLSITLPTPLRCEMFLTLKLISFSALFITIYVIASMTDLHKAQAAV